VLGAVLLPQKFGDSDIQLFTYGQNTLVQRRLCSSGDYNKIGLIHLELVKFPLGISKPLLLLLLFPNADLSALDGRLPLGPKGQWASCQQRSEECVYTLTKGKTRRGFTKAQGYIQGAQWARCPEGERAWGSA